MAVGRIRTLPGSSSTASQRIPSSSKVFSRVRVVTCRLRKAAVYPRPITTRRWQHGSLKTIQSMASCMRRLGHRRQRTCGPQRSKTEFRRELAMALHNGRKTHQTLTRLVKDTQKYKEELGLTGEGITSADQINMDHPNQFTNKWGQCSYLTCNLVPRSHLSFRNHSPCLPLVFRDERSCVRAPKHRAGRTWQQWICCRHERISQCHGNRQQQRR